VETGDMMVTVEALGRQATEVRDALAAVGTPPRGQPHAGVASSSMTRCRQIAAEMVAISGELLTQLRMFESSVARGRQVAKARKMAQAGKSRAKPTTPEPEPEKPEEDDEWYDDL